MTREEQLEEALQDLLDAVTDAKEAGCIDHLDCMNDGGEAFHDAMQRARDLV